MEWRFGLDCSFVEWRFREWSGGFWSEGLWTVVSWSGGLVEWSLGNGVEV